jgi:hypothetical protein
MPKSAPSYPNWREYSRLVFAVEECHRFPVVGQDHGERSPRSATVAHDPESITSASMCAILAWLRFHRGVCVVGYLHHTFRQCPRLTDNHGTHKRARHGPKYVTSIALETNCVRFVGGMDTVLFTGVRGRGILGSPFAASCVPPVPQGRRTANRSGPAPAAEHYILWWCIKMRCSE